jgi:hypothetical protein
MYANAIFAVLGQIMPCKNIAVVSHDNTVEMTAILDFRNVTSSQFYAYVLAVGIFENKIFVQSEGPSHMKVCSLDNKYRGKKIGNFFIILFYM